MAVETRVIIDANAQNAIREIGKLDEAAADADTTIKELDDQKVDVDTTAGVDGMDELRRIGDEAIASVKALSQQSVTLDVNTSEVATAAGDVDALQADAGTAITIPIDVDADKLDTIKAKTDAVGESGRAGSAAIGGIGGSISELPGIGSLGPIAESLGQLTENALEGGESIAGMTSAIGILGGTALVMAGIQKVMQSIAETKAFNKEKAESFKSAIDEVGDSTRAVLEVIKETQSVTGRAGGIFGSGVLEDTKDITKELDAAGVSVDEFTLAVQQGGPALDAAVTKLEAMKTAAEEAFKADPTDEAKRQKILEYNDAIEILKETHKTYADQVSSDESWAHWIAGGDAAKTTGDAWNTTLEKGIGWLHGTGTAMDGTKSKTDDLAGSYDEARRKADDLTYANALLRGDIDKHDAYLRLQNQFDETKRKGQEAMDAVKTGAADADTKMRDYELSVSDSKIAVMDFNDEWSTVDTDQTIAMNTKIDRGEFDSVLTDIGEVTSKVQYIDVRVRTAVDTAWNNVINSIRLGGTRI
ncbi:MAG: hypothetical protein ABWZ99_16335 [Ilumatobacteraceae bacterium]